MKRTYVACEPCRKRKVRCEIQDKPPCAKCYREHRECTFRHSAIATKRREPPLWTRPASTTQREFLPDDSQDMSPLQEFSDGRSSQASGYQHSSWQDERVMSSVISQPRHAMEVLFAAARPEQNADVNIESTPRIIHDNEITGNFYVTSPLSIPDDAVLNSWDKFRFVRQGWFTAQEAVTYIDL